MKTLFTCSYYKYFLQQHILNTYLACIYSFTFGLHHRHFHSALLCELCRTNDNTQNLPFVLLNLHHKLILQIQAPEISTYYTLLHRLYQK